MDEPLRQSTIYGYLRCPYQHHLRTTDPTTQSFQHPAAVFGTAVHDLIRQMHEGDWDLDLESYFLEAFDMAEKGSKPLRWKDEAKERAQYLADAVAILDGYRSKDYNRECRVLMAEATFTVRIGRHTVTGTVDQVRKCSDGSIVLVDFKTSKAAPPQMYVDLDYQLSLYAYALQHGTFLVDGKLVTPKITPDRLTLYFLRHHIPYKRATNGKAAGEEKGDPRISTTRTTEQFRVLKKDVNCVARMIRLGIYPRSPDPLKCGCCGYAEACLSAAREGTINQTKLAVLTNELENVA